MAILRRFFLRLYAFIRPGRAERQLAREIDAHLALLEDDYRRRGLTPDDARLAARRALGGVDRAKEHQRDARSFLRLEDARRDLRYAVRGLARSPGFTAVAVLTLALGVGVNTAIFTITNVLLFQPMPVERPDEIVRVYNRHHSPFTYADYDWFRERQTALSHLIAERLTSAVLAVDREPERARVSLISGNLFAALAIRPAMGRLLDRADRGAAASEIVLSHAFWSRRFPADPSVVGRAIRVNDRPFTIVGVTPPGFSSSMHGWSPDVFIGLNDMPVLLGVTPDSFGGSLYVSGRLRSGVTREAAEAELTTLMARLAREQPDEHARMTVRVAPAHGMNDEFRMPIAVAAGFLLAVSALVLGIACANLGNLLLARYAQRRREIGVRRALGASAGRIVRLLLAEGALLATAGAALALAATASTIGLAARLVPPDAPVAFDLSLDRRVLAFTFGLAAIAVIAFALIPAWQASRQDVVSAIRDAGERVSRRSRLRGAFLVAQVALCTVLLAGGALFLRSLGNARRIDPGFPTAGLLDVRVSLEGARYDRAGALAYWQRLLSTVRVLPGVEHAAVAAIAPLSGSNIENVFFPEGTKAPPESAPRPRTYLNIIGDDYFETMGIRMVRGRAFSSDDREGAPAVAIVNETLANRTWPGESAIGKRVSFDGVNGPWVEVVGVAANIRYHTLGEEPPIFVYVPIAQRERSDMVVHVRAARPAAAGALARTLSTAIRALNPALPPPEIKPLEEEQRIVLLPARIAAGLLSAFGALALLLAAVGIFGVAANGVAQRRREIGIRTALGARPGLVVASALRDTAVAVAWGGAAGVLLALAFGRLVSSSLYGVGAADPITFIRVLLILAAAALLAVFVPARRAARVDPVVVLRAD